MRYVFAQVAFGLGANALVARQAPQCIQLQTSGGPSGVLGQLDDGQNRIGTNNPTGCYCLSNGGFTDAKGRGCILTPPTMQFQCDMDAPPTSGFIVGSEGEVTYNGNETFYACPVNDEYEYNIYTAPDPGQEECVVIALDSAGDCEGGAAPVPSPPEPSPEPSAPADKPTESEQPYITPSKPVPYSEKPAPSKPAPYPEQPAYSRPPIYTERPAPSQAVPVSERPQQYSPAPQPENPSPYPEQPAPTKPAPKPEYSAPKQEQPTHYPEQPAPVSQPEYPTPQPEHPAPYSERPAHSSTSLTPTPAYPPPYPAAPTPSPKNPAPPPYTPSPIPHPPSYYPSPPPASPNACPADLHGPYEFPHLIIPVDSSAPTTPHGTSYNGHVSPTSCSLFNFDIPLSAAGKTCTLLFLFPTQAQLVTSSYTLSGSGNATFARLQGPADEWTTWANRPGKEGQEKSLGVKPGGKYVVESRGCEAGKRQGYQMCGEGGLEVEWFQDWNEEPIGMYARVC